MGRKYYSHSNYDKCGGEFRNYRDSSTNERSVEYIPPQNNDGSRGSSAVFGSDGYKINTRR